MNNKIENYYLKGTKKDIKKQLEKMNSYKRDIYKADGTIKDKYVPVILDLATQTEKDYKYYGKHWIVSRKRKQLDITEYERIYTVAKAFNLLFSTGNDGKRGGIEHDYINIVLDKRASFYKIYNK